MMQFITANLTNFGIIGVIIWQIIQSFYSGNNSLTKKMLFDYKERNEQLEKTLKDERDATLKFKNEMKSVIDVYKIEVGRLTATNDEKDKHIINLKEILQDKNPEVIALFKEIRDFLKKAHEQNTEVLSYQTKILEGVKSRNDSIDEASRTHHGEVTRVPL